MTTHIVLLRAVNVAGHGAVGMSDLRESLTQIGFSGVRTLLQSGNVVLQTKEPGGLALETLLEREIEKRLGLRTVIIARSAGQWAEIISHNPFPQEAEQDPGHLLFLATKTRPTPAAVEELRAAIKGPEVVGAHDGEVYAIYPAGIGRSKLTTALIERKLGVRVTGRNWNTVLKLAQILHT